MNRHVFAPAATFLVAIFSATTVYAQAAKAAPPPPPEPAKPAAWVKLHKGPATIDVIQGPARRIGNEMVTVLKVKNTSPGPLGLFKAEEFWYNTKMQMVSGDSPAAIKTPINPGDVVEITFRAPVQPDLYRSSYGFKHANGDVKATSVKKFK
jgi:hypothetical protein